MSNYPKLVVIAGKSCSGKDTIFKILSERGVFKRVVTYTTRPKRTGEINDVDYHFVADAIFKHLALIEKREYYTANGIWRYGSTIENLPSEQLYGMILTPSGVDSYKKVLGDNMLVINVAVDEEERFERAYLREKSQKKPDYSELCRRWVADQNDFSGFQADVVVDNTFNTAQETSNEIEKIIKQWITGEKTV